MFDNEQFVKIAVDLFLRKKLDPKAKSEKNLAKTNAFHRLPSISKRFCVASRHWRV